MSGIRTWFGHQSHGIQSARLARRFFAKELADAFMVEEGRDTTSRNKYCDAIPKHEGLRVVDLEALATDKFDCKRTERSAPLERPESTVKMR